MKTKFSTLTLPCGSDMANQIAEVQQAALAGYPLFEGYICPNCGWRTELGPQEENSGKPCFNCCSERTIYEMVQCGPKKKIVSDLLRGDQKPGTICAIAQIESKIIGFAQGFKVPSGKKTEEFLRGFKTPREISDDYFFIEKVAVGPSLLRGFIIDNLIEQMLRAQPYQQALLWMHPDRPFFGLMINNMDVKPVFKTRTGICVMISIKE